MNKQLWYLAIVTPIWFLMHMVIQTGGTGLEPYDNRLAASLVFVAILALLNKGHDQRRLTTIHVPVRSAPPSPAGYVYLLKATGHNLYKIGKSINPDVRESEITAKLPFPAHRIHLIECENRHAAEYALHRYYHDKRVRGEWFRLSIEDVNEIKQIKEM